MTREELQFVATNADGEIDLDAVIEAIDEVEQESFINGLIAGLGLTTLGLLVFLVWS